MVSRLFTRIRRPRTTVDIDFGDGPFRPGDTIKVVVSLSSDERLFISTGQIQLICTEVYYQSGEEGGTFRDTVQHVDIQGALFSGLEVDASLPYREEMEFRLPQDALPTVRPPELFFTNDIYPSEVPWGWSEHVVHIIWELRVLLNIRGRKNFNQTHGSPSVGKQTRHGLKPFFIAALALGNTNLFSCLVRLPGGQFGRQKI